MKNEHRTLKRLPASAGKCVPWYERKSRGLTGQIGTRREGEQSRLVAMTIICLNPWFVLSINTQHGHIKVEQLNMSFSHDEKHWWFSEALMKCMSLLWVKLSKIQNKSSLCNRVFCFVVFCSAVEVKANTYGNTVSQTMMVQTYIHKFSMTVFGKQPSDVHEFNRVQCWKHV